jgi:hypothetical protein
MYSCFFRCPGTILKHIKGDGWCCAQDDFFQFYMKRSKLATDGLISLEKVLRWWEDCNFDDPFGEYCSNA